MVWTTPDFERCLAELKPQISHPDIVWNLVRHRYRQTGYYPGRLCRLLLKLVNPKKPYFVGVTANGVRFLGDIRDWPSVAYATMPNVNSEVVTFIKRHLADTTGAYLDVGTNLGVVAATIARDCGADRKVIAFEPIPGTAKRAAATFALNGLKNVHLYAAAVGDEEGEITFYNAEGHSDSSSANKTEGDGLNWEETRVPCITLDGADRADLWGHVSFVKIDVEGHEPKTVRGGLEMIGQSRPKMIFEYNFGIAPTMGWTAEEVTASISGVGDYNYSVVLEDGTPADFPPPTSGTGHCDVFCEPVVVEVEVAVVDESDEIKEPSSPDLEPDSIDPATI